MGNNPRNTPRTGEGFKQTLHAVKEFILDILRRKKERIEEDTKDAVDEIIPPKEPEQPDQADEEVENSDELAEQDTGSIGDNSVGETTPSGTDTAGNAPGNPQELHFEDQDEYTPQDSEFGEAMGNSPRFAEIYPPCNDYYVSGKSSYFDPQTNKWSKKSQLSPLQHSLDILQKKHVYSGVIPSGLVSIPLPNGSLPDTQSLVYNGNIPPHFQIDQNNCIYIRSQEKQYISFNFYRNQKLEDSLPINEDSQKIVYASLSSKTQDVLKQLSGSSAKESAIILKNYITTTKKYSTKYQGTLHKKSNSSNYISNLDASPALECFSAAALFAAMCRELGIPARIVTGHMTDSSEDGKTLLGSNNGHAWNEFWDEDSNQWIHIDATPVIKEESGDDADQSGDSGDSSGESQSGDQGEGGEGEDSPGSDTSESGGEASESGGGESGESDDSGTGSGSNDTSEESSESSSSSENESGENGEKQGGNEQAPEGEGGSESDQPSKSPREALEELIEQAREDSLSGQVEELSETIDQLENATSKEDIRDILDKSDLSDFAKDMIDEIGNNEILEQEQALIDGVTDESDLDQIEQNSLLDEDYKQKLREYTQVIREKIEEEKKRLKSKMERMGFKEHEMHLYLLYKELEAEVEAEVRAQIKALERILPKNYKRVQDKQNYHRSGPRIGNTGKLIEHKLTGDPKVFRRDLEVRESNEINMYETIIIDRSGSMGKFSNPNSPMRASIKAAIMRAKVLEHFKVEFSIMFFDDEVEEIMEFGEVYTDKRLNQVPSRLMRALQKSGGTNIGEPLAYAYEKLRQYRRKSQNKSFGNISFIGDGEPMSGLKGEGLRSLIEQIRSDNFGLTAYYIGGSNQNKNELEGYFGDEKSGGTIVVSDIGKLTDKLIGSYNENLRNVIRKYAR